MDKRILAATSRRISSLITERNAAWAGFDAHRETCTKCGEYNSVLGGNGCAEGVEMVKKVEDLNGRL